MSKGTKETLIVELVLGNIGHHRKHTQDLSVKQGEGGREEKVKERQANEDKGITDGIVLGKPLREEQAEGNKGVSDGSRDDDSLVTASLVGKLRPDHGSEKVGSDHRGSVSEDVVGELPLINEEDGHQSMEGIDEQIQQKVEDLGHDEPTLKE